MKKKIQKFSLLVLSCFLLQTMHAQDPNWSINSSSYQYSMTFTAFLNINGTTLNGVNDKVAAFVNGEIRGVSAVVFEASVNKYVTYLTVFANTNKEIINFKIYDSTSKSVINIDKTETFKIDNNLGGIAQSYSIAQPQLNENSVFNSFSFLGITAMEVVILADKITLILPKGTDVSSLTAIFETSINSKVFVENVLQSSGSASQDFSTTVVYNVLSEDEATFTSYEVVVSIDASVAPTTVMLSTTHNLNTNSIPVSVDVIFSNTVSDFELSDFIVENAVVSSLSTSDSKNYKVDVIPLSEGDFSVQVPANVAVDGNNNLNEISNSIAGAFDISKPMIREILVDSDAASWWFLVTFNEVVLNVDSADFELKGTASAELAVEAITAFSENQYKVSISSSNEAIGSVSLQLKNTTDIKDMAENPVILSSFQSYFRSKRAITITADAQSKIYGEANLELTYQITAGSLAAGDELTGGLTRVSGENVGDYVISSSFENPNYEITFIPANLSITKRGITITTDAQSKIYGEADLELTYQITVGSLVAGDDLTGGLTRVSGENVGDYVISSSLENPNYEITFIPANLSITKRGITITADAQSKVYGEADLELTYQITAGSLAAGDELTGGLTRVSGENVGDYVISSSFENPNYELTFIPANLSITKRGITITTDAQSKIYGEADLELTYQITAGSLAAGDELTGGLTRVSGENVGDYVISSSLENPNYELTFIPANLSITKRGITITADAQSKVYGEADSELTNQITAGSLVAGDELTGGLTRVSGENVGDYVISSSLENPNYELTFIPANLSITNRGITITADMITKSAGEVDPELTYQVTEGSILSSDVLQGSLTRVIGEELGVYLIQLGSLTLGSNYEIVFVEANFIITNTASLNESFIDNQIKIYPNPANNFIMVLSEIAALEKIIIYNLNGSIIVSKQIYAQEIEIDIRMLKSGIYFVKIFSKNGTKVKKIVKSKR